MGSYRQTIFLTAFIFLVFFTVATVGTKFNLVRVRDVVFSREFVELLNDFDTSEDVGVSVYFDDADIKTLTEPCKTKKCRRVKSVAMKKYRKKMYALQCANSFIVLSFLHQIKNDGMLGEDGLPREDKQGQFEMYKTYGARMLSVLYYSRTVAAKWMVLAYAKLIVGADPAGYGEFVEENTFFSKYAHAYSNKCKARHMIRPRNWDLPDAEYYRDADDMAKVLYANDKLRTTYKYESMFTAETLTLAGLFDRQDVLFDEKPEMKICWQDAERLMDKHRYYQMKAYNARRWPFVMTGCVDYHLQFQHIVYTTVLYYAWFHLESYVFNRTRFKHSCKSIRELTKKWSLIIEPLKEAVEFLDADDGALFPILANVIRTSGKKIRISKLLELEMNASVVLAKCLKETSVLNLGSIFNHFWHKKQKDRAQAEESKTSKSIVNYFKTKQPIGSADVEEIKHNAEALRQYISNIKDVIKPIDNIFFIKFIWSKILKEKRLSFLPKYKEYETSTVLYQHF